MKHSSIYAALALLPSFSLYAQGNSLEHLMSMSLEELSMLDVEMETASKVKQKLTDIPSSVYVLSNERIQRSGAKTIAEALVLVPGLKVTKFNETSWFVSTRGFHDGLYNKMLVMIDGRSLFSPVYGGTYWTDVDYILADIERIEILKGPGGTIWGGNAANGVVNIITKSSEATQGTYVSAVASANDNYEFSVRQGLKFNEYLYGRAFYKYKEESSYQPNASDNEIWKAQSAGMVFEPIDADKNWSLRFGGEKSAYRTSLYTYYYDDQGWYDYSSKDFDNDSHSFYAKFNDYQDISSQTVLSYSLWGEHNKDNALDAPGSYSTVDFDSTLITQLSDRHQLTFGGGIRYMHLDFSSSQIDDVDFYNVDYYRRAYDIESANDYITNIFIQSQLAWNERLSTVMGVKLEHFTQNSTTELSPQLRVMYKIDEKHSLWSGVSRAVVAPSYMDSNSVYLENSYYYDENQGYVDYIAYYGQNNDLDNENVITTEIGYRFSSGDRLEVDSTAFYSIHDNVRQHSLQQSGNQAPHVINGVLTDDYEAKTYGIEIGASYKITENLKSYFSYSYLSVEGEHKGTNPDSSQYSESTHDIDSEHLATAQVLWNVYEGFQFDVVGKYMNVNYPDHYVSYTGETFDWQSYSHELAFDARLGWKKSNKAPLFEVVVENIGKKSGYQTDYSTYKEANQESVYVRVSHEF